mgnify:CR=1 FL=1
MGHDRESVQKVAQEITCCMLDREEVDIDSVVNGQNYINLAHQYLRVAQIINRFFDTLIRIVDWTVIRYLANQLSKIDKKLTVTERLKLATKIYNRLRPQGYGPKI